MIGEAAEAGLHSVGDPNFVWVTRAAILAREAGAKLRDFLRKGVVTEYKGDVDLVTIADRTVEAYLREAIPHSFPGHGVFGEEGTRDRLDSEYRWYIDPLDGTTNFAHGVPHFCVSLGLEHRPAGLSSAEDGPIVAGVIYDPMRDELFAAERGLGAFLNGKPIHVSVVNELSEALVATGFPSHKRHDNPNIHFYQEFTLRSHGVRRAGSAALDLAYTACGRYDAYWEFNLNPWDTAAGFLLVEEAGGMVTGFDGSYRRIDSLEVLASNQLLHHEMLGFFQDMFAGKDISPLPSTAEYAARRAARQQSR